VTMAERRVEPGADSIEALPVSCAREAVTSAEADALISEETDAVITVGADDADPPSPPGVWRVLMRSRWRALLLPMGIAQLICAATYDNWFGMAAGALAVLLYVACVAAQLPAETLNVDDNGKPVATQAASWRRALAELALGLVASAAQGALLAFVVVLLLVRVASPDPRITTFPSSCDEAPSALGCARLAADSQWRMEEAGGPVVPPSTRAMTSADAFQAAREFFEDRHVDMSTVLRSEKFREGGGFLHARCVTLVMGYADDVLVRVREESGEVVAEVQSQLRFGVGDMGTNSARIQKFNAYMEARFNDNS